MKYLLTMKSANKKTGPIPVSISSAETCPTSCAFKGNGCYAEFWPSKMHWDSVTKGQRGTLWSEFLSQVREIPDGQLWRHNQAGDLDGEGDRLDIFSLVELMLANRGKKGFCFTHKPLKTIYEQQAVRHANDNGFTVNLSANNLAHADELANLKIGPVVVVLPEGQTQNCKTPTGRPVIVCPAYTLGKTCADCGICYSQRKPIVGFPAHGQGAHRATNVVRGRENEPISEERREYWAKHNAKRLALTK